jgi:hypothetical protein
LKALPLQVLNLRNCRNVTNDGLSDLPLALRTLQLDFDKSVDDRATPAIGKLTSLDHLFISGCPIGDRGISRLTALPLKTLDVAQTEISDACLSDLLKLVSLEELDISNTRLSDKMIARLVSLPNLRCVNLNGDVAGAMTTKALLSARNLRCVYLHNTPVTADQKKALSLHHCKVIDHRRQTMTDWCKDQ